MDVVVTVRDLCWCLQSPFPYTNFFYSCQVSILILGHKNPIIPLPIPESETRFYFIVSGLNVRVVFIEFVTFFVYFVVKYL